MGAASSRRHQTTMVSGAEAVITGELLTVREKLKL
jgi:hypothetical protein